MTNPSGSKAGYAGQAGLNAGADAFNQQRFLLMTLLGRVSTVKLVQVKAINAGSGDPPAIGSVDVLPLVNMINGIGEKTEHGTIYNVPFFRLQGGVGAVIMEPVVDDIGLMLVCDRDISNVKANKAQANPGSYRMFDLADGLYLGGFLNGVPERYIRYKGSDLFVQGFENVTAEAVTKIKLTAPTVEIDAATAVNITSATAVNITSPTVTIDGALNVTGEVTAKSNGGAFVRLSLHRHAANNQPPIPGT
jgi:hypothetical protein